MSRRTTQFVALVSALAYSLVAVGGHGLHALSHWIDGAHCVEGHVHVDGHAHLAGGHEHHGSAPAADPAADDDTELSLAALVEDSTCCCSGKRAKPGAESSDHQPRLIASDSCHSHACAICAVLAQVKVGYHAAADMAHCVASVSQVSVLAESRLPDDPAFCCDARGPPVFQA